MNVMTTICKSPFPALILAIMSFVMLWREGVK